MHVRQYRIIKSSMAVPLEEDDQSVTVVPKGAIVIVDSEALDKDEFIKVLAAKKRVLMLSKDIRSNSERVWMAEAWLPLQ